MVFEVDEDESEQGEKEDCELQKHPKLQRTF
jgi:hypothetical protein